MVSGLVKMSQHCFTKIWQFLSSLSIFLFIISLILDSGILKELILTVFASLFVAFVEG